MRLTDEQRALRDLVRELSDERIALRAPEIDEKAEFPWDIVKLLADHDVLALPFPV
ncbi:MAG: acyl-CoA dehydrogenase family protein [Chloroflexi bacterium]|nr:acyl-CoA dehydrogenase family protein [Chloroflexota bacterium]